MPHQTRPCTPLASSPSTGPAPWLQTRARESSNRGVRVLAAACVRMGVSQCGCGVGHASATRSGSQRLSKCRSECCGAFVGPVRRTLAVTDAPQCTHRAYQVRRNTSARQPHSQQACRRRHQRSGQRWHHRWRVGGGCTRPCSCDAGSGGPDGQVHDTGAHRRPRAGAGNRSGASTAAAPPKATAAGANVPGNDGAYEVPRTELGVAAQGI